MNEIEKLKENYDKMSYLERLEYLAETTGYINMNLKKVVNIYDAYDFVKENIDNLVNIVSVYKNDIELSKNIHTSISDITEVSPQILTYNIEISILITILDELSQEIISNLP